MLSILFGLTISIGALTNLAKRSADQFQHLPGLTASTHKKYNVDAFVRWYLVELSR